MCFFSRNIKSTIFKIKYIILILNMHIIMKEEQVQKFKKVKFQEKKNFIISKVYFFDYCKEITKNIVQKFKFKII